MIQVKVQDYCHNCPDFEADVNTNITYSGPSATNCVTTIRCEHAQKCLNIMKYLEAKKETESHANNS